MRCNICGVELILAEPSIKGIVGVIFRTEKKGTPRGHFFLELVCEECAKKDGVTILKDQDDGK